MAIAGWKFCYAAKESCEPQRVFRVYRAAGLSVKRKKRKHLVRAGQPVVRRYSSEPAMGDRLRSRSPGQR